MKTFIARQPIFNREKRVMGYELLFRDSVENFFPECASDVASASVIASSSMVFGLDALTHGKPAFINATKKLLVGESFGMLPASMTVVEVLETVEADEEVVEACRRLKEEGYQIALDDFVYRKDLIPLLKLANVVKVDFKATDLQYH